MKFDSNNVLITIGIDEYILVESELYSFDSLNVKLMDNYGIGWNVLLEEIMKVVNKDKSCLSDISDDNPMNIDHPVQKRIKEIIDFAYLKKEYSKMIVQCNNTTKIPKELLFDPLKIYHILKNED